MSLRIQQKWLISLLYKQAKIRDFSPQANYTDRVSLNWILEYAVLPVPTSLTNPSFI
jgi:hypothetical protein